MTDKMRCLRKVFLSDGIVYSRIDEEYQKEIKTTDWITIRTTIDHSLSDNYVMEQEITVRITFALRGAIADGSDVYVESHAFLQIFPDWCDALREEPTFLWAEVPEEMLNQDEV